MCLSCYEAYQELPYLHSLISTRNACGKSQFWENKSEPEGQKVIMRRDTWKSETSSPPLKGTATAILNLVYSSKASRSCWVTPTSTQQWKHTGERIYCRMQLWHCKNKTDVVEVPTIVCSASENKAPVALNSSHHTFLYIEPFFFNPVTALKNVNKNTVI